MLSPSSSSPSSKERLKETEADAVNDSKAGHKNVAKASTKLKQAVSAFLSGGQTGRVASKKAKGKQSKDEDTEGGTDMAYTFKVAFSKDSDANTSAHLSCFDSWQVENFNAKEAFYVSRKFGSDYTGKYVVKAQVKRAGRSDAYFI